MPGDFFYSKSTKLYLSRKPLSIDARVKKAADKSKIILDWNDEGIINNIDFDDSKKLMQNLGAKILTPIEYWAAYKDAIEANDLNMLNELQSSKYTEWLDRVYLTENKFIDAPEIIGKYKYIGRIQKANFPHGRPGWFNPEENMGKTGEPLNVENKRKKFATSWKYWSPDLRVTKLNACAPIRGYVTSVGKPSYDLGIPVDAKQPKLMMRECRYNLIDSVIDSEIIAKAQVQGDEFIAFIEKFGGLFSKSKDSLIYKMREEFFDKLGDISFEDDVSKATMQICPLKNKKLSFEDFAKFIRNSRKNIKNALKENKDIIFVMGHKNPDTDASVSCLFEAYRNQMIDYDNDFVYVPIIQSERIPDEVKHLIGDLSDHIILSNDALYKKAKSTGLARWISVDQNREPEVQKYFITIIDHHLVCESAKNRNIPKTLEMLGSTSALITRKYLGMGLEIDKEMARILYGATLMDTENRVEHKMTLKDVKLMDYLKKKSEIINDNKFYGELMSYLLNTDDADILFKRDYKEDWGFGFAVAKIKNGFSEKGEIIKKELVSRMYDLTVKNNQDKNLPLTLLKITNYKDDNELVSRERLYFVFNKGATKKFRDTVRDALEGIIRFEFPDNEIEVKEEYIEFWGKGLQLSRKKTAPVLEPIVASFNRYFFSASINKWIKRDFLKRTKIIKGKHSVDEQGRINYITYEEAKKLAKENRFEILSLKEYWKVLSDAKKIKDIQMIESLQGSNFVEFLDSKVLDKKFLVNHDEKKIKVSIPFGNPGLIHPNEIDTETGLPKLVRPPNEYGNKELWRYWQPDSDLIIWCRSYIFLLDQPCLDGKFHLGESFPNLGVRPIVKKVVEPEVKINWNEKYLNIEIFEEGETQQWKWPKRIWEF